MNRRWHRENDMRHIIRDVAEKGEKMVQKENSLDYKEAFEETDSFISDLYISDSDEEWNELKKKVRIDRDSNSKK